MQIPKYWARETRSVTTADGQAYFFICWQWSDDSSEDAQRRARERIAAIAHRAGSGAPLDRYGYGDRPLREEIVQTVSNAQGERIAAITRNAYGSLVLNAARVMFVDIDIADEERAATRKPAAGKAPPDREEQLLEQMRQWTRRNPQWAVRAYRTRGGLRCLVTHDLFDPAQESTRDLLRQFQSDPLYVRLCVAQECFRARLTPKPWRCDMRLPPARYPYQNARAEQEHRQWVQRYESVSLRYGVCKFLQEYGSRARHPDAAAVLDIHDRYTRAGEELRLA